VLGLSTIDEEISGGITPSEEESNSTEKKKKKGDLNDLRDQPIAKKKPPESYPISDISLSQPILVASENLRQQRSKITGEMVNEPLLLEEDTQTSTMDGNVNIPQILLTTYSEGQESSDLEEGSSSSDLDSFAVYMVQRMKDMLNENDMNKIVEDQNQLRQSLESSASSLTTFNEFSASKYDDLARKF
ncbi:17572_t:CDS:2, partial [Acaulospora morrowiae]